MSGCCGQGPVIVSGAAATPRVDVEALLMCDVLADGTVAGVALVEPIYDTGSGDRVGVRVVDPATGAPYTPAGTLQACQPDGCTATTAAQVLCDTAVNGTVTHFVRATTYDCQGALLASLDRTLDGAAYTVTGTVGLCPASSDCEEETTPTATVGLCLADGTPIAVTVVRDCTGAVTSEGWLNLSTGAWSAGAVPVGTVACGDSRSIAVSGTFCDVDADGEVVGLVLVEYSYAADGSIAAVRLVDATTGSTYTPTGTVTTCPAGVAQPEQDVVQLCDVAADGTSTPFVRDYRRDELGAISGHSDYTLDGTPYAPTGTVGACQPPAEPCRNSTTVLVCDADPDCQAGGTLTATAEPNPAQYPNWALGGWCLVQTPGQGAAVWSGGSAVLGPDPACPTSPSGDTMRTIGVRLKAGSPTATAPVPLTVSLRVTNNGPNAGVVGDGRFGLWNAATATRLAHTDVKNSAPVGHQQTLTLSATVPAAALAAGQIVAVLDVETYQGPGAKAWTVDQFQWSATVPQAECEAQFLRTITTDCDGVVVAVTDTTLDGAPYTPTGVVGQCTATGSGSSDCRDCEQVILCDTVGTAVNSFLRTVCRDCNGAVLSITDTALDGSTPYEVAGKVGRCCDTRVVAECTYSLPDTSARLTFTDPAYPDCWLPTGLNPAYTYGDRVTSWAANYRSDTGSAAVVLFSSPDLGGAISFAAFTPALPISPANSSPSYVGTAVINGVTVTLTATGGDGLARWSANNNGLYLNGTDSFRLDFSKPVRLAITTSAFGDPLTVHERFCGVTAKTVPWQAVKLSDCNGNITIVDPDTREPIPAGATLECQAPGGCGDTEIAQLCDLVAAPATPIPVPADSFTLTGNVQVIGDTLQFSRNNAPVNGVAQRAVTGLISGAASELLFDAGWGGGGNPPATNDAIYRVDVLDGATVLATSTVNLSNGSGSAGAVVAQPPLAFTAPSTGSVTVRFTDLSTGGALNRDLVIRPLTVETEGTEVTSIPFLRAYTYDCTGQLQSTTDTELDGATPYAVTGAVGQCATPPAECEAAAVQAFRLCDLNPAVEPDANGLRCATPFLRHFVYACDGSSTFHDTAMDGITPYTPVQVVECGESPPSLREQVWNTVSIAQDPVNPLVFTYTVANSEDPTQTGTVKMTASKAFGGGCGGSPTAPVWNAAVTFTFEPDANVLALADVLRVDAIDWDTWEDVVIPGGSPLPNKIESDTGHTLVSPGRWHSTINNNTGHFYFNGPPPVVRMSHRNDGGGNACVAPAFGFITLVPGPPCGVVPEVDHLVQPLCDVAAAGTTPFLRHWSVDNSSGQLTRLLDTRLDGTTSYTTTGTVTVCGQETDQPVLTGVRRVSASTTVQNLKTEFPGLQSVSLSVIAGSVNVAMSNGTSQPIPAGASVTWSVADTDDSSLAAASFAGVTTAADYFLVWIYKGTAAG
ncbi:hypothetical protein [Streptomyces sp. NPDC086782]|uniref:hypothetical protein n=1 Tax=Streptomyces sp. NPDC086782 TaxID=3365757 RepID=UPI0037FF6CE1